MTQNTIHDQDDEVTNFADQPLDLQLLYVETLVRQGQDPEAMGLPSLQSLKEKQQQA